MSRATRKARLAGQVAHISRVQLGIARERTKKKKECVSIFRPDVLGPLKSVLWCLSLAKLLFFFFFGYVVSMRFTTTCVKHAVEQWRRKRERYQEQRINTQPFFPSIFLFSSRVPTSCVFHSLPLRPPLLLRNGRCGATERQRVSAAHARALHPSAGCCTHTLSKAP